MQRVVNVLIAILVVGLGIATAARPNFSGQWNLNADKSDFGMAPAISNRTDKIVHKDPPADHPRPDDRCGFRNERVYLYHGRKRL